VAELGLADLMAVARTKLLAALPAGAKAERVATRFHLDAAGWFRATDAVALLPTIARAVWNARYVRFRYAQAKGAEVRKVGPVGLVLKAGIWYLVAQKGSTFRTYRVGKILEAETLDEPYARPLNFDLAAWWARSSREYEANTYTDSATVRLSPRGCSLLDLLGPYVVEGVAKTASKPDKRGWIRCTIPLEPADSGIRELMRLGDEVEVISPVALRARMAQTLRKTLQQYAKRPLPGLATGTRRG
jgi:predicted DNA-binding transcriptional regulator YafY